MHANDERIAKRRSASSVRCAANILTAISALYVSNANARARACNCVFNFTHHTQCAAQPSGTGAKRSGPLRACAGAAGVRGVIVLLLAVEVGVDDEAHASNRGYHVFAMHTAISVCACRDNAGG